MKRAVELAKKGVGHVNPNPMVGAVIVKNGRIIGEGYHEKYGAPHAEPNAIANCAEDPEGATIYVTLEPCCHFGKTPPCTEAIIKSGISEVIIGTLDPNLLVSGAGAEHLKKNGIKVTVNILQEECDKLNEVFFHYVKTQKPFVVMKYAMTLDGKIATHTGDSKWITGSLARAKVHEDRHKYMAIMVGVGTIIADDPLLNCRSSAVLAPKNPIRIICDTNLRTPPNSQIIKTAKDIETIIATSSTDMEKYNNYPHCKIITIPKKNGHIDLAQLMLKLGEQKIDSILLEGGATLNWSALKSGIVKKVQGYIAPKIFGGKDAKTPVAGAGIDFVREHIALKNTKVFYLGDDILIESEVEPTCLLE